MNRFLLTTILAAGAACAATAQNAETVYLVGSNQVVGQYPAQSVDYMTFRLPQGVTPMAAPAAFQFGVADIKTQEAMVAILPADPEMTYLSGMMRMEKFQRYTEQYGSPQAGLFEFEKSWYEMLGSMYGEDWVTMAWDDINKGPVIQSSKKDDAFPHWGETYIIYAIGIDHEGNVTAEAEWTEFTLENVQPDPDLTFTVSDVTTVPNGKWSCSITATITPSNRWRDYMWNVASADQVDQAIEAGGMEALAFDMAQSCVDSDTNLTYGTCTIEEGSLSLRYDTDYYIVVFGWNGGVTTDVTLKKFHTDAYTETPEE